MSPWRALRYRAEGLAAMAAFGLLGRLPRTVAADVAGRVACALGPWLPVSRIARRNIRRALPELTEGQIRATVARMWDNLGRVVAEYPHLGSIDTGDPTGPVEIVGLEHLAPLRAANRPVLFVSAHFGNWEIASLAAGQAGMALHLVYRPANNPIVERLVQGFRRATLGTYHPKGRAGARELMAAVKRGEHLGLLADQKLSKGIAVDFFGRPAKTGTALADLALRFDLPIVLVRVDRQPRARFRLTLARLEPPLQGTRPEAVAALLAAVNATIEAWIRDRPDHWLWLHRRWPD